MSPPNPQPPSAPEPDFIQKQGLTKGNQLRMSMGLYQIRGGPKSHNVCLYEKRTQRDRESKRKGLEFFFHKPRNTSHRRSWKGQEEPRAFTGSVALPAS